MDWQDAVPGDYPVFLVGAGFPLALLDPTLPSTGNLIQNTATKHGAEFPLLEYLSNHAPGNNTSLDFVWSNLPDITQVLSVPFVDIVASYGQQYPHGHPMSTLANDLLQRPETDGWKRCVLLGVELKRMVALQYDQSKIQLASPLPQRLRALIESLDSALWVSFNYDLVVERVLEDCLSSKDWRYAFEGLFESDYWNKKDARHVIVKPHGSVNLWFETDLPPPTYTHSVAFCDKHQPLVTCDWNAVGRPSPNQERRPCVIGYLPESLKDEINSPGQTADASHDFHKWNLTHAGLSLHRATSIFILGYSLPLADGWMWNRIIGLPNKGIDICVASKGASDSIVNRLRASGFKKAAKLCNGDIS